MIKTKSEFGKGLVICLAKFMEHFSSNQMIEISHLTFFLKKPKEEQEKILSGNPPPNLNYGKNMTDNFIFFKTKIVPIYGNIKSAISSKITLWANGASDHLYEIKTPKGKEWNETRKIIKKLQNKGLDMGHGNGLMGSRIYEVKDLDELKDLTKKALVLIDEKLGLKPDWGKW